MYEAQYAESVWIFNDNDFVKKLSMYTRAELTERLSGRDHM